MFGRVPSRPGGAGDGRGPQLARALAKKKTRKKPTTRKTPARKKGAAKTTSKKRGSHKVSRAKAPAGGAREISVAEFFEKNRHMLGFDSPSKALLMTVKEADMHSGMFEHLDDWIHDITFDVEDVISPLD